MQQFKKYDDKLNKLSKAWKMANNFDYILNNIWSTYSFYQGKSKWLQLELEIEEPFRTRISIEMSHVEIGQGVIQARLALKDEIEKYINFLIENNIK